MRRSFFSFLVLGALLFAACGDAGRDPIGAFSTASRMPTEPASAELDFAPGDFASDQAMEESVEAMEEQAMPTTVASQSLGSDGGDDGAADLQTVDRQVISTASVALRVEAVPDSVDAMRTIAEAAGGFVEQMSISGEPGDEQAELTLRVPQDGFFAVLERIAGLGDVLSQSVGSRDVTEQYIDLTARLRSLEATEVQLVNLLGRAETVADVLVIERELARIRGEIERLQGQLNFLERQVALATITVSVFGPQQPFTTPPSASITVAVGNVSERVTAVRALVEQLDGVVDRVVITVEQGAEFAFLSLRLPRDGFDPTMEELQRRGEVIRKETREGGDEPQPLGTAVQPAEPDARIELLLVEQDDDAGDAGLIAAIVVPIGSVLLIAGGALMLQRRRRPLG